MSGLSSSKKWKCVSSFDNDSLDCFAVLQDGDTLIYMLLFDYLPGWPRADDTDIDMRLLQLSTLRTSWLPFPEASQRELEWIRIVLLLRQIHWQLTNAIDERSKLRGVHELISREVTERLMRQKRDMYAGVADSMTETEKAFMLLLTNLSNWLRSELDRPDTPWLWKRVKDRLRDLLNRDE